MNEGPVFNNFDLNIGRGVDGVYPVSVPYSPAGETTDPVQVPIVYDDQPMRRWLKRLEEGSTRREELLALGQRLTGYLLPPGPVRNLYQRSLGMTHAQSLSLRLRLRISPPELAAFPWEYAYDEEIADFFVLNPRTALVRYHSQPVPPRPITSHAPVPILALISNPPGTPPLETARETRNLVKALGRLLDEGRVSIDVLFSGGAEQRQAMESLVADQAGIRLLPGSASLDALRDALRQGYRVVHYIGHGMFDDEMGGALILVDDYGDASQVGARVLARELRGASAAVVVLNACRSATESTARSLMGLAPNLIRAEVPAVVAMQYSIADSSATVFSRALYGALADGWPLDAAVTEGRKAISARVTEDDMDWGIPVLFMRSSDGVLWEKEPGAAEDEAPAAASPRVIERSGGVDFYGPAQVEGDVVARDKVVHGDQVSGDKIVGHVDDVGPGAQVAIGKDITQRITRPWRPPTAAQRREIHRLLADLERQLADLDISQGKRLVGGELVGQLKQELTRADAPPHASTVQVAGDWLLDNLPALSGSLAHFFLNPVVAQTLEASGDIVQEWVNKRFAKE